MHYNVNVAVRYTSVLFGKGDGVSKEFFGDGRVEVFFSSSFLLVLVLWVEPSTRPIYKSPIYQRGPKTTNASSNQAIGYSYIEVHYMTGGLDHQRNNKSVPRLVRPAHQLRR